MTSRKLELYLHSSPHLLIDWGEAILGYDEFIALYLGYAGHAGHAGNAGHAGHAGHTRHAGHAGQLGLSCLGQYKSTETSRLNNFRLSKKLSQTLLYIPS